MQVWCKLLVHNQNKKSLRINPKKILKNGLWLHKITKDFSSMSIIPYKSSSIQVNNKFNSRENKLINKNCLKTTN